MTVHFRYLGFPRVVSENLASSALAMRRLADDWECLHGWRPVLIETFVDETRFRASCSRAAHRERIGDTAGRGRSRKGVSVRPLARGAREFLRSERDIGTRQPPTRAERGRSATAGRRFPKRREALVAAQGHPTLVVRNR